MEILRKQYEEYAAECKCALRTVTARLENLRQETEMNGERSLFDSIEWRIKSFDSVVEKCRRKGYDLTFESIKSNITDIVGVRVVTPFRDDIYTVEKAIIRQPSMSVMERRDYVEKPKHNGYQSLHLIVFMEIYFMNTSKAIPVEIQIRDKAMDLWATLEHIVGYKNPLASPDNLSQFKRIAEILNDFDETAMELRNYVENAKLASQEEPVEDSSTS
ncbi:GTP pyrophosphokinase family protein [Candidatus Saccharibacteria bacterium]|nr:GTP pyrophosphokinase family protein [Candidatus Saccharibacteria bacterium]